jgi:nicotinic acid phosphoribosyltransferase
MIDPNSSQGERIYHCEQRYPKVGSYGVGEHFSRSNTRKTLNMVI